MTLPPPPACPSRVISNVSRERREINDSLGFLKSRRQDTPPHRRVIGRDGDFWLHDHLGDHALDGERMLARVCRLLHYYPMIVHLLALRKQASKLSLYRERNFQLQLRATLPQTKGTRRVQKVTTYRDLIDDSGDAAAQHVLLRQR